MKAALPRRVNPLMGTLLGRMQYYWVTAQCEYSTDVMFKSEAALKELYPKLMSHSALCFGAKEIMGFLVKKLAGTFRGESVSDLSELSNLSTRSRYRLAGMRIKHRGTAGCVALKGKVVARIMSGISCRGSPCCDLPLVCRFAAVDSSPARR